MSTATAVCALCGEPMPAGEEMFKYHGYSGPCPKPPLSAEKTEPEPADDTIHAIPQSKNDEH